MPARAAARICPAAILAVSIAAPPWAGPAAALDYRQAMERAIPTVEACPGRPGFVRAPGGRSCTRLTGRVAAGVDLRAGHGVAAAPGAVAPAVTGRVAIDNRTETDLGEVRTYVRIGNGRR